MGLYVLYVSLVNCMFNSNNVQFLIPEVLNFFFRQFLRFIKNLLLMIKRSHFHHVIVPVQSHNLSVTYRGCL